MKNGRLVGAAETCKERAEWRRLQPKKLEHTEPAEKERVATEKAVGKYAKAAFAKRKKNRAVCLEYQIMREEKVKVGESRTLARKRGIRAGAWSGKGGLHSEGRQIARRKGRRASLGEVEGSMSG